MADILTIIATIMLTVLKFINAEMKLFITFFLSLISLNCFTQNSKEQKPDYLYFKSFAGWQKNGERLNRRELKEEFYKAPLAIPYYKKAITNKTIAYLLMPPTIAFALLSKQETSYPYHKRTGFTVAGIISSGSIILFLSLFKKNIKWAAKLHNEYIDTTR